MENIVVKQKADFADRFLGIFQSRSSIKTGVLAGVTTFIIIAYILVLNPQILFSPYVIIGDPVMAEKIANGVFIGIYIGALIETVLCTLYARAPFARTPGMGLNAFFAYTIVLGMGYTYGQALVIVFLSGIFFIVIAAVGLREATIRSIPDAVKMAITPGIRLFITIIRLKDMGIIVSNPATLVSLVDFSQWKLEGTDMMLINGALTALIGLIIIEILHARKVKSSVLLGIIVATLIGIPLDITHLSNLDMNIGMRFRDFAEVSLTRMDFAGLFAGASFMEAVFTVTMLVVSFSLVNMFDSIGTLLGVARQPGMIDENGEVIRMKQVLMSDAVSTLAGAMVRASTVTTVVESSAGTAMGGRAELTSLITTFMFLGSILLIPITSIVPAAITMPALIFVNILMLGNIGEVDFSEMSNTLPVFCTIVLMPSTCSIANGVTFGLITYCLMRPMTGRKQGAKALTLMISVVFVVRYAFMTLG